MQGSHTVTYTELVCNGANYNQASLHYKHCIQEAETVLSNRDEITNTLRQHIEKLEELYKKVVYQSEENRLKYWMAIQELENCKRFQKVSKVSCHSNFKFELFLIFSCINKIVTSIAAKR